LKNTVGAALAYDAAAEIPLVSFDGPLSAEERHKASFFVGCTSALLRNRARELLVEEAHELALDGCCRGARPDRSSHRGWIADAVATVSELGCRAHGDGGTCALLGYLNRRKGAALDGADARLDVYPAAEELEPLSLSTPPLALVVLHEQLSREATMRGFAVAAARIGRGGLLVVRGCTSAPTACALMDAMAEDFPLWSEPIQVGASVVMRRR
jgi:hypothetical protein